MYLLESLEVGGIVEGPGVVIDDTQTILIVPGAKAVVARRHLYITLD